MSEAVKEPEVVSVATTTLSPDQVAKAEYEKTIEDVRKTRQEVRKIEAEVLQLTKPYRTLPFYFTCATTVFSAIAAITAIWGVTLQNNLARQDYNELQAKKEKLDAQLKTLLAEKKTTEEQKQQADVAIEKSAKALKAMTADKQELEGSVAFAARYTLRSYDDLQGMANSDPATTDPTRIQFAKDRLAEFLATLRDGDHDYATVIDMLKHDNPDVRRFAAVLLSQLDKDRVEAPADRTKFADLILTNVLTGKADETAKRLQITAIGRLGKYAAPPLLAKVLIEKGEPRLNVVRAMGELGTEAPDDVTTALIGLLDENNKQLQQQAVIALAAIGRKAARAEDSLARLLPANPDGLLDDAVAYSLTLDVISALGEIGAGKPETVARLDPLFDVHRIDCDVKLLDELQRTLLVSVGSMGPRAAPALTRVRAIVDAPKTTPAGLIDAAVALARIGSESEIERLARSPDVRFHVPALVASTALASAKDRQAVLRVVLQDNKDKGSLLAPSAIRALTGRGKDSVPVLIDALPLVTNAVVREAVVKAIGEVGKESDAALTTLLNVASLKTENSYVVIAAIRSLQFFPSAAQKKARETLEPLVSDPKTSPAVSNAARGVLFASVGVDKSQKSELKASSSFDATLQKYYSVFQEKFEPGFIYQIDLISTDFDAFLYLKKDGKTLAFDDDSGGNLNSRIYFDPPEADTYNIWATTYARSATGNFRLEIRKLAKKG